MTASAPLPHDSARLHVTGAAQYIDDIPTPANTLHLAFGLATIAKGTIARMDLEPVKSAPNVKTVMTAADLPFENDVSPAAHDEPLLSDGTIHYHGQPVFLVAATSHMAARRAARLARVTYESDTPVLTIEDALAADSRFEEGPRIYARGDVAFAMPSAPHRISGTFEIGGQEHFYLESHAALAIPQDDGGMLVHSSTQHPTEIQHKVAEALGVGMHMVRVQTRRMGGGFGGKESQGNALAVACAVAARHTGRPCKMRYDRDDDMIITGKRHDFRIAYDVSFDNNGHLIAVDFHHYTRGGWAQDLTLPVADRAMLHADNAYYIPNMRIESHRLKTNTASATAFRGFGGPQGMIGIERVMDHIAHYLGCDPLLVRQRNFYAPVRVEGADASGGDIFEKVKAQETHYGMEVRDFILDDLCADLLKSCDYAQRRKEISEWNAQNDVLKRGIAVSPVKFGISFTLTHLNQAGALVHVYQDGTIAVNHGGTEMGQGLFQKVAQVAASRFGVSISRIRASATDTDKVPNTSATAASSGSDLNGMAVQVACDTIRSRMAAYLADQYGKTIEDVVFQADQVHIGRRVLSFEQAVLACYHARISLSSTGFYKTPDIAWDRIKGRGQPFYYFSYGAAVSEVVIDTLTGENRILRTDILHDTGHSLNPAIDIGQIEGGFIQGAGWVTTEELVWDDAGRLRTHAPSTYKIPAMGDRPPVFNVGLWGRPNPQNTVYRSKAVGEPPFMLGISVYLALRDAISACGPKFPDLNSPATPQEILQSIARARG